MTDLDQLRTRRQELQEHEDAVSYVRRVAQGRADLARAELARRRSTSAPPASEELREILADRLLGADGRPPRPAEDFSGHPLAAELDRLCADHGFGRMADLDAGELAALTDALDAFETKVSAQRQQVFAELDALTDELVEHYREQQVEGS